MRVIIAGGGTGGLATALALRSPLGRSTAEMLCYRRHYGAAVAW
jgi:cation diffusion facilitator CzcD-associated flavoprotein CzcO